MIIYEEYFSFDRGCSNPLQKVSSKNWRIILLFSLVSGGNKCKSFYSNGLMRICEKWLILLNDNFFSLNSKIEKLVFMFGVKDLQSTLWIMVCFTTHYFKFFPNLTYVKSKCKYYMTLKHYRTWVMQILFADLLKYKSNFKWIYSKEKSRSAWWFF